MTSAKNTEHREMNPHEMETVSGGKIPSDSVYYEMLIHLVRKYYDKLSQFMALHMIEQELDFFHYTRKEVKEAMEEIWKRLDEGYAGRDPGRKLSFRGAGRTGHGDDGKKGRRTTVCERGRGGDMIPNIFLRSRGRCLSDDGVVVSGTEILLIFPFLCTL